MAASERKQTGSAWMERDGAVVLRLRMAAGASVGDAEVHYASGNADYGRVRRHLPFLAPGTLVPVYDDWN